MLLFQFIYNINLNIKISNAKISLHDKLGQLMLGGISQAYIVHARRMELLT